MNDTKKKGIPLGPIALLALLLFILSPFGNNLVRESFLSFKNGNIVGQSAPSPLDGVSIVAYVPGEEEAAARAKGWTLYTFFSPT